MEIIPGGVIADTADLTELRVNTVIEQMKYDVTDLKVKAGKKVKLTFANPDFLPHNLVITNPGKATEIGNSPSPSGRRRLPRWSFIPENKDILHHTKLLDHGETDVLEFTAPTTPATTNTSAPSPATSC